MTESPKKRQETLPKALAAQEARQHYRDVAVEQVSVQAMECVLSFLRNKPDHVTRESAVFIERILALWAECDVAQTEIWAELEARIDLSEKLLRRGIRARKGGRYRSTKLP